MVVKNKSLTTNMNPHEKQKHGEETQKKETVDKRQEFSPQEKIHFMKFPDDENPLKTLRGRVRDTREPLPTLWNRHVAK